MQKALDKMTKDIQLDFCDLPWMTSGKAKQVANLKASSEVRNMSRLSVKGSCS